MDEKQETIEAEVMPEETRAIQVRPKAVPSVTISELARMPEGKGIEIIRDQAKMIEHAQRASIHMTKAQDWLLFKAPDGSETAYLQDKGCSRGPVKVFGIQIYPKGKPEKVPLDNGGFMYVAEADGFCNLTGEWVLDQVGHRSTEDKDVRDSQGNLKFTGAALDWRVRDNACANRDGRIVRTLAGLESVPAQMLRECGIDTEQCTQGRGYSSEERRSERAAHEQGAPLCPDHKIPMVLKKGKTGNFWGCPKWSKEADGCKRTIAYKESRPETESEPPEPDEPKGPPSVIDLKNDLLERIKDLPANVKAHFGVLIGKVKTEDDCIVVSDELLDWLKRNKKGDNNE